MILRNFDVMVIGASAGGWTALGEILPYLPPEWPLAVVVVLHLHPTSDQFHLKHFSRSCSLQVKDAEEMESLSPGVIYFASPQYHLLIERDRTFSFSSENKVCFSRPSIDVLFESAATAYGSKVIGVILTGANTDGAVGLLSIKEYGGTTVVQDPKTAESPCMPQAAIRATTVDYVLDLPSMRQFFIQCSADKYI
nr:chemotaxis protein CheB [Desulfobulbaceae bacterium]